MFNKKCHAILSTDGIVGTNGLKLFFLNKSDLRIDLTATRKEN